jgi:hypothetical protein
MFNVFIAAAPAHEQEFNQGDHDEEEPSGASPIPVLNSRNH